jgi:hypothetical protein
MGGSLTKGGYWAAQAAVNITMRTGIVELQAIPGNFALAL